MFIKSIRLIVGTLLLAIGLRTWLVMGLIAPVTVSGSSMVPTLRGAYITVCCPRCNKSFDIGAEYTALTDFAACPRCVEPRVPLNGLSFQTGDRLWIDRTAYEWRSPRRGDVVVSCCPHDAERFCVKRVVGLPGESVQIAYGDIRINGRVLRKTLGEQIALRQTVYVAEGVYPRWKPQGEDTWSWKEEHWRCEATSDDVEQWLRYTHLQGRAVTDDSSYNAGVSRKLNRVSDFMLSGELRMAGGGTLVLKIDDGRDWYRATISLSAGTVQFAAKEKVLASVRLSATVCDRLLAGESVGLVYSNFDRQLLLAFDDHVALHCRLADDFLPAGTSRPVAIGARGGKVSLEGLTLFRDIYYGSRAAENSVVALQLGPSEYFLLGDNAPISVDSRRWGAVSGRLLLGRALGVR